MSNVWDPEVEMSENLARYLIETQFPELSPVEFEILDYGFDNTVIRVNRDWVFRFPRREIAVKLLETEGKLLPEVKKMGLPLDSPCPIYYGKPSSRYKWPFLGYNFVKGVIPSISKNTVREGNSARLLAHFLKKLHSMDAEEVREMGVPYDELARLNVEKRIETMEKNIYQIKKLQLYPNPHNLVHYLNEVPTVALPSERTLVHGDLHFKNMVVNPQGILSGIIDWGDVHLGHRAIDLNSVYSFLSPLGRETFFREYGEVSSIELEYARFKAVYTNVILLLYGYYEQQEATIAEARKSLELALFK